MNIEISDGVQVEAYCPNTSRLVGLLDGHPDVLITENDDSNRKTDYTVRCIRNNNEWVGIEASKANNWFENYIKNPDNDDFTDWNQWDREEELFDSQIDFLKRTNSRNHWVEVKSLSSRSDRGSAFYSATPSKRAYRHLRDLSNIAKDRHKSTVVFVIQRPDVDRLKPAKVTKDRWVEELRRSRDNGVSILAYKCCRRVHDWVILERIPAIL